MAEGLLRYKIPSELQDRVKVCSSGTLGLDRNPATNFAIEVAHSLGADIFEHRSQGIDEDLVRESDIIFALAPEHLEYIQNKYPEYRENVFLLKSFGRGPEEKYIDYIEDPIGAPLKFYQECGETINSELDRVLPRLKQLIEKKY